MSRKAGYRKVEREDVPMIGRIALVVAANGALPAASALAQSPRVVGKAGDWVKTEAAGLMTYENIDHRSGSTISIGCDEAMTLDHSATSIETDGDLLPICNSASLSTARVSPFLTARPAG